MQSHSSTDIFTGAPRPLSQIPLAAYAAYSLFPEDSAVLTVEFKVNMLAPAQGDHLEAVGKVVRSGRTLTVSQMEVFGVRGNERTLVAIGQQTLMCIQGKASMTG